MSLSVGILQDGSLEVEPFCRSKRHMQTSQEQGVV